MRNTERQKDILVTLVTLVTLFRSANQFYRAECITILGFFSCLLQTNQDQVFPSHMVGKIWPQEHLIPLSLSKKRPKKLILKDGLPVAVIVGAFETSNLHL